MVFDKFSLIYGATTPAAKSANHSVATTRVPRFDKIKKICSKLEERLMQDQDFRSLKEF